MLERDDSFSIHVRNLQYLATEMFKISKGLSPDIMKDIFNVKVQNNYALRQPLQFTTPSVHNGTETVSFLGRRIWHMLPASIRNIDSIAAFKNAIKKWKPENFPCRLCKVYVENIGFI